MIECKISHKYNTNKGLVIVGQCNGKKEPYKRYIIVNDDVNYLGSCFKRLFTPGTNNLNAYLLFNLSVDYIDNSTKLWFYD